LAAGQRHVLTYQQALRAGLSRTAIFEMHDHGWFRIYPNVYVTELGDFEQELMAVQLWAGEEVVISHRAAAGLQQIEGASEEIVEVTLPPRRPLKHRRVTVHRGEVPPGDRRMLRGICVTTPLRTLIDLASVVDEVSLAMAVEHMRRCRQVPLSWIRERLAALGTQGRPGMRQLQRVLEDSESRSRPLESALEVRLWWMLKASSLPLPEPQHEVRDSAGTMRIDFAFLTHRLAVETDSVEFHAGSKTQFEDHCERSTRLTALGWSVMHLTYRAVGDQAGALRHIARALEVRR
jgi:very-short-patch-repair endonuclease